MRARRRTRLVARAAATRLGRDGGASAGDERTGARATAVALAGPSPLGGPADLVLVAEEPGVGLGARLAGSRARTRASTVAAAPGRTST